MKYLLIMMIFLLGSFVGSTPEAPKKNKVFMDLPVPLQTLPNLKKISSHFEAVKAAMILTPPGVHLTTYATYTSGEAIRILYLEVDKPVPELVAEDMLLAFVQYDYNINNDFKVKKYLVILMTKAGKIVLWGYGFTAQRHLVWEDIPDDMAVKKEEKKEKDGADDK